MIVYSFYIRYMFYAILAVVLPVLLLGLLKIAAKWTSGRCRSFVCLKGKTAIITGACSGIGFETALALASRGCRVIIADVVNGEYAKNTIIKRTHNDEILYHHLDLASLKSVRQFAEVINSTESRLDILINNAGTGAMGNKHTEDGLHETMQVNHFGSFLLTHLLVDLLKKSAPSRIIFTSSILAFASNLSMDILNYPKDIPISLVRTMFIYGNSKLCNVITANGFAERLKEFNVTANSLHPGVVQTQIYQKYAKVVKVERLFKLFRDTILYFYGKTVNEGAQTLIDLAVSNKWRNTTGRYFVDCTPFLTPPGARNKNFCTDVWHASEKYVQLKDEERI